MASEDTVSVPVFKVMRLLLRMHFGGAVFFLLLAPFSQRLYTLLYSPFFAALSKGTKLIMLSPVAAVEVYFMAILSLATIVGAPWVLYQLWIFIRSDLIQVERRFLRWFLVAFGSFTELGAVAAYYMVLKRYQTLTAIPTGVRTSIDAVKYTSQINAQVFLTVAIVDLLVLVVFLVLALTLLPPRVKSDEARGSRDRSLTQLEVLCLTWGVSSLVGVVLGLPPNVLVASVGLLIGLMTLQFYHNGRNWPAAIGTTLSVFAVIASFWRIPLGFLLSP